MYCIGNIILKARELPPAGLYLSNLKIACTIPFELLLVSVNFFSVKAFVTNWLSTRYTILKDVSARENC